eukprot:TRINITY_DN5409_c0_g1_i1.p1 TRINITY_DN5409_c0_g1~~TRINITY_DN5409_c0_g1_i1.p1  ORF type:complete len:519 (-),score=130.27 TRINITY_DN5409_c0_g1_i1:105-1610(-)
MWVSNKRSLVLFGSLVLLVALVASSVDAVKKPRFLKSFPRPTQRSFANDVDAPAPPAYETNWFTQVVDHFNDENQQTFQQRYLTSSQFYQPNGPLVFYTGNEGSIDLFWNNTGFAFTIAEQFGAYIVFAEHRYYGESMPFGDASFELDNVGYLSVEQVLADYANIIHDIKGSLLGDVPVISLGGSYGGMLTAWFRMKYPSVVDAALAASAPIRQFLGTGADQYAFYEIIDQDFAQAATDCDNIVRDAFTLINTISNQSGGLQQLQEKFKVCGTLDNVDDLLNWLEGGISYEAMADYPYPANFLEPMPGYPINLTCQAIVDGVNSNDDLLQALIDGMQIYFNYTGQSGSCFNMSVVSTGALGNDAWDYQACTQIILVMGSNNVTDFFPPAPWNVTLLSEYCEEAWHVNPDIYWATTFGYSDLNGTSNIIFSNGMLDPWRGGGVQTTYAPDLPAILIEGGAHHLDLRTPNPADPASVIEAREMEINYLQAWIQNAYKEKGLKA